MNKVNWYISEYVVKLAIMGCGSSGQVLPVEDANGNGVANGNGKANGKSNGREHDDDLPTVMLPETPVKPKPRKFYTCITRIHITSVFPSSIRNVNSIKSKQPAIIVMMLVSLFSFFFLTTLLNARSHFAAMFI